VVPFSFRFLPVSGAGPSVTASRKLLFRLLGRLMVAASGTFGIVAEGSCDTDLWVGVLVARLDALPPVDGVFERRALVGVGNERPNSMLLSIFRVLGSVSQCADLKLKVLTQHLVGA
jgi:hypothetical protein